MKEKPDSHFTVEAEAVFRRFAGRYGFSYEIETGSPMELCWLFPEQRNLSTEIILGLQNGDELNFGVDGFWSYFFPFDDVVDDFKKLLDTWALGNARVAMVDDAAGMLQLQENERWVTIYRANLIVPFWRRPKRIIQNCPESDVR